MRRLGKKEIFLVLWSIPKGTLRYLWKERTYLSCSVLDNGIRRMQLVTVLTACG